MRPWRTPPGISAWSCSICCRFEGPGAALRGGAGGRPSPAEIVDALGGRYRLSERGAALPIDPDDKAAIPALQDLGTQADR